MLTARKQNKKKKKKISFPKDNGRESNPGRWSIKIFFTGVGFVYYLQWLDFVVLFAAVGCQPANPPLVTTGRGGQAPMIWVWDVSC